MADDASTAEMLDRRARSVFPGGVSHNVRHVDGTPFYATRAEGAHLVDADGNRYVDFWMNHHASLLGHAHPSVRERVREQAARGLHYGTPNEPAIELGERVCEVIPSAERVRFCASGTEATMYATRLARAVTGRTTILKAEGGWHGGNTDLANFVNAPFDEPDTIGLPPGMDDALVGFPINDREAVADLLAEHDVAGVIVEPMLLGGGGIEADPEFLSFLRDEADDRGFVLILDEVVTGFRVAPGSMQERHGIMPDLTTLGKVLGGGLPVGAICGHASLFERSNPTVPAGEAVIAGGGTFSSNPMTAVAGLATLDVIDREPVYERTEARGARIRTGLAELYRDHGIDARVLGTSSFFLSHFEPVGPLRTVADVETGTNREALVHFHRQLYERGYYLLPGHMGSVSYQTSDDLVDGLLAAARDVVEAGEIV